MLFNMNVAYIINKKIAALLLDQYVRFYGAQRALFSLN